MTTRLGLAMDKNNSVSQHIDIAIKIIIPNLYDVAPRANPTSSITGESVRYIQNFIWKNYLQYFQGKLKRGPVSRS
ncbi:hypothetical protein PHMEG_0008350 [Phytophthora megakarya]|uniref:Uncharacterized protein n=1 Tax=Phytophthora megakarya TaxID=4795 RepID=A0A225WIX9_9STRA|nr:hypothetical protein PHMEG_0008350 [Phytophthora megakarya]